MALFYFQMQRHMIKIFFETLPLYITESINKASNAWGLDCLRYEISEYISITVKPVLSVHSKIDKTKV